MKISDWFYGNYFTKGDVFEWAFHLCNFLFGIFFVIELFLLSRVDEKTEEPFDATRKSQVCRLQCT
jgi:uncharacterized membrane protein YjgN (DUF898 family)